VAILAADVPWLLLLGLASRGRWKRWVFLSAALHFALALRWLGNIHPLQVVLASLVLSVSYLLAGAAIRFLVRRGVPWVLAVPTALVHEELFRTVWLGGMPWPTRSLSCMGSETLVASSGLLGAYALSFAIGLANATLAGVPGWLLGRRAGRPVPLGPLLRGALATAAAFGVLAASGCRAIDGFYARVESGRAAMSDPWVLVSVQGNIPQSLKHAHDPTLLQRVFDAHVDLSAEALEAVRADGREALAVLWPETMIPWPFLGPDLPERFPEAWENEIRILQHVAGISGEDAYAAPLYLLGAIHHFRRGDERHPWVSSYGTTDSLFLVDPAAVPPAGTPPPPPPPPDARVPWILGRHDKRSLVPGGEYTPLGDVLPPLRLARSLVSEIPELDAGAAEQPLFVLGSLPGARGGRREVRAGTIICFEVAFPARCRAWRDQGAGVLLNAANYGWFGETGFRAQIQALAMLRAAETATTVVMAGNTGPTLFFDPVGRPYGRFLDARDGAVGPPGDDATTHREGFAYGRLWLDGRRTLYVGWGDHPWHVLGLVLVGFALRGSRRATAPARASVERE
jgi:apolipoprotein N-acyltransferase